jgi:hypothetical protein
VNNAGPFINRLSAWAPGFAASGDWDEWAQGRRTMCPGSDGPEIAFTDSLFRRQLSQLSKMTVQVVHDLLPLKENIKMIFLSFRGEIARQYKINKMQIEEGELTPRAFSLSVFNAPPALAGIALGLKGGYSALYPAGNVFAAGLKAAQAALYSETDSSATDEIVFVYADEEVPSEYAGLLTERPLPVAFALLLSRKSGPISFSSVYNYNDDCSEERTPESFLKSLLLSGLLHVST